MAIFSGRPRRQSRSSSGRAAGRSQGGRQPRLADRRSDQQSSTGRGSGVFSYYNNSSTLPPADRRRNDETTPIQKRPRTSRRDWLHNMPSLVALIAVTLSVLYGLSLSTKPRIVILNATGPNAGLRDAATYQQGAQAILDQSVLSHTKFTVNSKAFEKRFITEFPEVSDVSLTLPLVSRRPIVTITTAQPALVLTAHNQAYVLDKRGTVIMLGNDLGSVAKQSLLVVNDQSGLSVSLGKTVLPTEYIQFITDVNAQFKAKQLKIASVTLPAKAHEVDFKLVGQNYYIKMSIDSNAREAAGTYLAVKQSLEQNHTTPAQYIDVRIPERAYYQ